MTSKSNKATPILPTLIAPKAATVRSSKPAPNAAIAKNSRRAPAAKVKPKGSKQSQLVVLLKSATGATIEQMTRATGWQAHTVRGTISGVLRKRLGLHVLCAAVDGGARVYRIVAVKA